MSARFAVLTSGSLSLTQSIVTLLRRDFDRGEGLAKAPSMYDAARVIGEQVRRVGELDRDVLERDDYKFNVHLLLGGQVKGGKPELYLIYPQGNPLMASEDSPYLQIGETKYGRPILDRGIRFDKTTLEEAAKYALLSLDSTMKSNVTVGPPVDLLAYSADELNITRQRRFAENDPDLMKIRVRWEQSLRQAVLRLPDLRFRSADNKAAAQEETIQLVEPNPSDTPGRRSTTTDVAATNFPIANFAVANIAAIECAAIETTVNPTACPAPGRIAKLVRPVRREGIADRIDAVLPLQVSRLFSLFLQLPDVRNVQPARLDELDDPPQLIPVKPNAMGRALVDDDAAGVAEVEAVHEPAALRTRTVANRARDDFVLHRRLLHRAHPPAVRHRRRSDQMPRCPPRSRNTCGIPVAASP